MSFIYSFIFLTSKPNYYPSQDKEYEPTTHQNNSRCHQQDFGKRKEKGGRRGKNMYRRPTSSINNTLQNMLFKFTVVSALARFLG